MRNAQLCLPGCEEWFAPADPMPRGTWKPSADSKGPRRLLRLLEWFYRTFPKIYPRISTLASKLSMDTPVSERSVLRWLSCLRQAGRVTVKRLGPRPCQFLLSKLGESCRTTHHNSLENKSTPSLESAYKDTTSKDMPQDLPASVIGCLNRAVKRIKRATNPAAYRQAIISSELRLLKWAKEQPEPAAKRQREIRWEEAAEGCAVFYPLS